MRFSELIATATEFLKNTGKVSYRALRREYDLDEETLDDLVHELIAVHRVAAAADGEILIWAGPVSSESAVTDASINLPAPASYTPTHLADRIRQEQAALESRGTQDGERKTITALFADLKGSTALLEGLDPEEARAVIDPALQIMMDAVHRYEGYVAQALGDGILALFGAPLAHEDHAQRAVYAALRMQEESRRYSDQVRLRHGAPLALRVGLNTGEVVVRSIRKDDLHTDYVPVGHSINLAARMEQMATPGSILITAATQKLVEGYFVLKALGTAAIKGVEQPLAVFEVSGVGQLRTRLQIAARRGLTRFVGRHQELTQMQRALDQARDGRGQVIGIMGEPGMGKSRLVHEFKLSATGFAVFEAYSASHGKASPYLPLIELLKGYFQIQLQDDERTRREKVIGKMLGLDRSLEDVLPYYFALLNIDDRDSPLPLMDPQMRRRKTFEALKRATLRASLEQPLLLIFEDLHWIDSETQGFLDSLVESIGSTRILLLTNYRPEYRHDWGGKSYCTQLRLAPFSRAEAEEFLTVLLGDPAEIAGSARFRELRQLIMVKTEGTPFFMEEVVQELFEQGVLHRDSAGLTAVRDTAAEGLQIPATVQGVLAARIDRLAAEEKALLQQLSVIGREFAFSLARQVVDKSDDDLNRLLGALQRKEFLYEQPAFPEIEFIFKHALTQEVAYNSLLHERRKTIHERTAQTIELIYQHELDDHYGDLAHHYSRSGNVEKAIEYLLLAGAQAAQRSANAEAVNHFGTAVRLLDGLPPSPENQGQTLAAVRALAVNLAVVKGFSAPEVGEVFGRAHVLCEKIGTLPELCAILLGFRAYHCLRGDCIKALEYAEEASRVAEVMQDPEFIRHGLMAMAFSNLFLGNLAQAFTQAERGLAMYDYSRDHSEIQRYGYDSAVGLLWGASQAAYLLGYGAQSRRRQSEMAVHAQQLGHPSMLTFAMATVAIMHRLFGDHAACLAEAEALVPMALEHEYWDRYAFGLNLRGWARSRGGHPEALADITQGLSTLAQNNTKIQYSLWIGSLAEAHANDGNFDSALGAIENGLAVGEQTGERWFDAEFYRLRGEYISRRADGEYPGAAAQAEKDFEHAIQIARQQQAKTWELRATMSLARLWASQGRSPDLRERLATLYGWFTEGFDSPDLQEAAALLETLTAN